MKLDGESTYQLETIVSTQIIVAKLNASREPLQGLCNILLIDTFGSTRGNSGHVLHLAKTSVKLVNHVSKLTRASKERQVGRTFHALGASKRTSSMECIAWGYRPCEK